MHMSIFMASYISREINTSGQAGRCQISGRAVMPLRPIVGLGFYTALAQRFQTRLLIGYCLIYIVAKVYLLSFFYIFKERNNFKRRATFQDF